jgi:hypothetical protein
VSEKVKSIAFVYLSCVLSSVSRVAVTQRPLRASVACRRSLSSLYLTVTAAIGACACDISSHTAWARVVLKAPNTARIQHCCVLWAIFRKTLTAFLLPSLLSPVIVKHGERGAAKRGVTSCKDTQRRCDHLRLHSLCLMQACHKLAQDWWEVHMNNQQSVFTSIFCFLIFF